MKALFIISPEDFRDEEFRVPFERLEGAGVECTVAGLTEGECKGMLGMTVAPDVLLEGADVGDFDAVVVVGGSGSPKHLWGNEDVLRLVSDAAEAGKVVAGICLSGAVLAQAGVLQGKNATVFPSPDAVDALEEGGAVYRKKEAVVDGRIVTAEGPDAAGEFADCILKALGL